jgi:hypothetical protein
MNAMFKKFSIKTCRRKIHFLGQMYLETISLPIPMKAETLYRITIKAEYLSREEE